jgi:lysophospholipase L1-like esterase
MKNADLGLVLPTQFRRRILFSALLTTFFICQCQSQLRPPLVDITNADTVGYRFLNKTDSRIENATALNRLFAKMYEQRTQGGRIIHIVHVGDSHILGDYLTREVRDRMQKAFGDGGRGLIFPYSLAGSNGPRDFLANGSGRWSGSNCVRNLAEETHYGISGFSLRSDAAKAELSLRLRDTTTAETKAFTKVTVFQYKTDDAFAVKVHDAETRQDARLLFEGDSYSAFYFDRPVTHASVSALRTGEAQRQLTLDGVSLENELAGVVYHSIGVNGAKFSDFARANRFASSLGAIQPDLIILSFGTNEAQGRSGPAALYDQMDDLVGQLHEHCPNTAVMLTTPADSYLRGKGFNPHMAAVCAVIRSYAQEHDLPLWDLYQLGGGEQSAATWKANGLLSGDSVHYSRTGYAAQGKLFYQGLVQGYNDWVEGKP